MKMPEKLEDSLFAPCGIDCGACYGHLKKKKPCGGCLVDGAARRGRCEVCSLKTCARERGFVRCFECPTFPCARLRRLDKTYRTRYGLSLVEQGERARRDGVAAFLSGDALRWKCACGGAISQHDRVCSECGAALPPAPSGGP